MERPDSAAGVNPLLDALFPPGCVACDALLGAPGFFCGACAPQVDETPGACCGRCGEPGRFEGGTCPRCRARPPPFARAWAPFAFEGAVARAVHRFKYEDHPELSRPLAALLGRAAERYLAEAPGALVPVPLHGERYRARRYDQATLLAHDLGRQLGRPLLDDVLTRTRSTTRQVDLTEAQREANVHGAFRAERRLDGQPVVLVDDVVTTGATAREAARVLLEAGAGAVHVLAFARAGRLDVG